MRDLFIYHPGSGTLISLADPTFLVDRNIIDSEIFDFMEMGSSWLIGSREHKGIRLDNYNMTNLFFGGK